MAGELLTAYIKLTPTVEGLQGAAAKALAPAASEGDKAGRQTGGAFASSFNKNAKRVVKAGLAGGGLLAGVAIKKGIDRLLGIEDARASLAGLGHDAKTIDRIMGNALDSVRGTAFGMADAGKVAASAVAAGIKPGKDLTKNLKLVADAATIAKTDMGSMGSIFNKVAASNKIQGDVLAQLGDMGIPIVQLLAKELGVTAEETVKLASKGQINFATFSRAMQDGLGGAALKSGDTTRGAWANMQASLGRIGANLLTGLFPKVKGGFQSITDFLTPLEAKATTFGEALSGGFDKLADAVDRAKGVVGQLDFSNIDGAQLGDALATAVRTGIGKLVGLGGELAGKLGELFDGVDWVGLGIEIGKQVPAMLLGLVTGILNFDLLGLLGDLAGHWQEILVGILIIAFAPAKLIGGVAKLLAKIPLAGRLLAWFVTSISKLGAPIRTVASNAIRLFGAAFREALGFVGPGLITRLLSVLRSTFPGIATWARGLATRLGNAIESAFLYMGTKAGRGFLAVLRFFASIPGRILRAVGRLADILAPGARAMISGLLGAARARFGSVVSWLGGLPSRIRKGIPSPKDMLKNIGGQIIDGLIVGISKSTEAIRRAIGNVGSAIKKKIKSMFGIASPSRWMRDQIGKQLVAGMVVGLVAATPLLQREMDALRLAPTVSPFEAALSTASRVRADASSASVAGGSHPADRPIYTDTGVLIGWIREIAGQETRLIWNDQAEYDNAGGRRG